MVFAFVLAVIAGFRPAENPPPYDVLRNRLICFALACFFLAGIVSSPSALKMFG
jgi:hypothetical protein